LPPADRPDPVGLLEEQNVTREPGSALVDTMSALMLEYYAGLCGWTLARAHARAGDANAIDAYLGTADDFDIAITDFSQRHADQNEADYQTFVDAVRSGRIPAVEGL
jgi:hypothetical protein